ncbi:pentatricopeptide repeat-containing protein At5g66520-like [Herrania umbratica]|uniref:Pentatricopeptide repeat-containing protein At5g66520-like n=1 Tax=Herrania umbratica TaxID=108875 RepID=A0A6J1B1C9_9ROSI|nr:pentatricopeptide repeat-containing protein At5g66520-like [Herrania umbratica]
MVGKLIEHNEYTFPLLLKIYAEIRFLKEGEKVHARVLKLGLESNLCVKNSLIRMYSFCGQIAITREVFDDGFVLDLVTWNSMIDGYAGVAEMEVARELFEKMLFRDLFSWNCMIDGMIERTEVRPNSASLVSIMTACANLRRLDKGLGMDLARDVFDQMPDKNVFSWTSMITGYGMHGHVEKALEMFIDVEKRGRMPDAATFLSCLSACKKAGKVFEGLKGKMPVQAGAALWRALLSACRTHSKLGLGELIAKRLIELEPMDVGPYVLLSYIYSVKEKWGEVEIIRKFIKDRELSETSASPHQRTMIYSMLMELGVQLKLSCGDSFGV